MAKLTGVKVLDMTGGEVTKIAYEGAEYVRVEREKASAGDIARVIDAVGVFEIGDCYVVHELFGVGGESFANIGEVTVPFQWRLEYFSKINDQPTPTLADRVTAVEAKLDEVQAEVSGLKGGEEAQGAEGFRKVDREPRAGDYVKFTHVDDVDITVGKYYEVTGLSEDGNPKFYDDGNYLSVGVPQFDYFEIYEEVAEAKRKAAHAKIFTDAGRKVDEYKAGDVVENRGGLWEVTEIEGSMAVHLSGGRFRFTSNLTPIVFVEDRLDANA